MNGFADIHSHFVYGVDDGAQTQEQMCAMLDAAYQNGVVRLYSTPHVVPGVKEFPRRLYLRHLAQARSYCAQQGYAMRLFSGAELLYTPQIAHDANSRRLPVLEGTRHVLIEFSPRIDYQDIQAAMELLMTNGYQPVLAHAERYACLFRGGRLKKLKNNFDIRVQINASTVIKPLPLLQRLQVQSWFAGGWVDHVASDAHDTKNRPFRMKEAFDALSARYGENDARRLTEGFGPIAEA